MVLEPLQSMRGIRNEIEPTVWSKEVSNLLNLANTDPDLDPTFNQNDEKYIHILGS